MLLEWLNEFVGADLATYIGTGLGIISIGLTLLGFFWLGAKIINIINQVEIMNNRIVTQLGSNATNRQYTGQNITDNSITLNSTQQWDSLNKLANDFIFLLNANFPEIGDIPAKTALKRVHNIIEKLRIIIMEKTALGFSERLKEPDVQVALNDIVQASARRGEKANPDILVNLLIEKLSNDSDELLDIILNEAILVTSKLTKEQIAYITCFYLMDNEKILELEPFSSIEKFVEIINDLIRDNSNIPQSHKIALLNTPVTGKMSGFARMHVYEKWETNAYSYFKYKDVNTFKEDVAKFCPELKPMFDNNLSKVIYMTSIGNAIAIANINRKIVLDYKLWIFKN